MTLEARAWTRIGLRYALALAGALAVGAAMPAPAAASDAGDFHYFRAGAVAVPVTDAELEGIRGKALPVAARAPARRRVVLWDEARTTPSLPEPTDPRNAVRIQSGTEGFLLATPPAR